jgi:glycosyltransferase involved in cell wall biosynthesis
VALRGADVRRLSRRCVRVSVRVADRPWRLRRHVAMRIAIDLLAVRTAGMKNYTCGFLPALGRLSPGDDFLVFLTPDVARLVEADLPSNMVIRVVAVKRTARLLWEQIVLPIALRTWRADVLFAPFDIAPFVATCPILLAVRNPSPALIRFESGSSGWRSYLNAQIHKVMSFWSCRKSRLVFYPTRFAADLLGAIMHVPERKRRVVAHGMDRQYFIEPRPSDAVLPQYVGARQYVLYVSGFYPYKHPEVLIDAFRLFVDRHPEDRTALVLVGADLLIPNAKRVAEHRLREQVRTLGLEDRVIFPGQVPREHLVVLYQNARAFVLPTVMETFGQPFVEAMASAAPVLCADMPFAREICGDAARYFPPGDRNALADLLETVLRAGPDAAALARAGRERSAAFSWTKEAEGTLSLLVEAARRP